VSKPQQIEPLPVSSTGVAAAVALRIMLPSARALAGPYVVAIILAACGGGNAAPRPAEVTVVLPSPVQVSPVPTVAPSPSCPEGMVSLPGGSFTMGDRQDSVTVQSFCMDVTEVTADAYAACVRSGSCSADHPGQLTHDGNTFTADTHCNYGVSGKGTHPMNCVDWGQSATYCHAQGKRLPTEEEWEWAARGGSQGRTFPWGSVAPDSQLCWSGMQKRDGTCAVGSFREGDAPGGIHDLAGNVWEWTQSNVDATGAARVVRGGCWYIVDASYFRAAFRNRYTPGDRHYILGFRCAR
jgi:sulfatase modifying factor 1